MASFCLICSGHIEYFSFDPCELVTHIRQSHLTGTEVNLMIASMKELGDHYHASIDSQSVTVLVV